MGIDVTSTSTQVHRMAWCSIFASADLHWVKTAIHFRTSWRMARMIDNVFMIDGLMPGMDRCFYHLLNMHFGDSAEVWMPLGASTLLISIGITTHLPDCAPWLDRVVERLSISLGIYSWPCLKLTLTSLSVSSASSRNVISHCLYTLSRCDCVPNIVFLTQTVSYFSYVRFVFQEN